MTEPQDSYNAASEWFALPDKLDPVFLGRSAELARIMSYIADPLEGIADAGRGPVVVLDGEAGVGKTSLAVEVARAAGRRFNDFVVYLSAESLAPGEIVQTIGELLRVMGHGKEQPHASVEQRLRRLRTLTSRRRGVVVIDDAKSMDDVEQLISALCANSLALLTSRGHLRLPRALNIGLTGLNLGDARALYESELGNSPASADERTVRDTVVSGSRGNPLLLKLAARLLGELSTQGRQSMAQRIVGFRSHAFNYLEPVLDLMRGQLDSADARVLEAASVAPGRTFSTSLLADMAEIEVSLAADAAKHLAGLGLLSRRSGGRYGYGHDAIRDYLSGSGSRVAQDPDERSRSTERMLTWYLESARENLRVARAGQSEGEKPGLGIPWFNAEAKNLTSVIRIALQQEQWETVLGISDAFEPYLLFASLRDKWLQVHEWCLSAARKSNNTPRIRQELQTIAGYYSEIGEYLESTALLSTALSRSDHNVDSEASLLLQLGRAFLAAGEHADAISTLERLISLIGKLDEHRPVLALAFSDLAVAYVKIHEYDDALHAVQISASLAQELQRDDLVAASRELTGQILRVQGNFAEASLAFDDALFRFRQVGSIPGESRVLRHLARSAADAEHLDKAIVYLRRCLELQRQGGVASSEQVETLELLSQILIRAGDGAEAVNIARQGIANVSTISNQRAQAAALYTFGLVLAESGEREAESVILRSVGQFSEANDYLSAAIALAIVSELRLREGDMAAAHGAISEAIKTMRALSEFEVLANALVRRGQIYNASGNTEEEVRDLEEAASLARAAGRAETEALVMQQLTVAYSNSGKWSDAASAGERVLALLDPVEQAEAYEKYEALASDARRNAESRPE